MVRAPRRARPRPPAPAEAIGGDGNGGRTSRHRLERSMLAGRADHAQPAGPTRAASLEVFVPFSTRWPRRAVRGGRPSDDPASAFHVGPPARRQMLDRTDRPCGFALRRTKVGVACALADVREVAGIRTRPASEAAQWAMQIPSSLASDAGVTLLVTRSIAHPTNQAAPARVCRPGWVMRRCAFSHGVPLPTTFRALAAWSSGGFFPHPLDGAHGVAALRRFAPARG